MAETEDKATDDQPAQQPTPEQAASSSRGRRKRGRPKGSGNKGSSKKAATSANFSSGFQTTLKSILKRGDSNNIGLPLIGYLILLLGMVQQSSLAAVIGLAYCFILTQQEELTHYKSYYQWLTNTFWVAALVGVPLELIALTVHGFFGSLVILIILFVLYAYLLYRLIHGLAALFSERNPG